VAGEGIDSRGVSGGHWPLVSRHRGILSVRGDALVAANRLEGIAVYTVFDGQVVDAGETVGRAKIIPFAMAETIIARAEAIARQAAGLVAVRPFRPSRVGAVVQESLGERAATRFREAFGEKVAWFGCELIPPRFVPADAAAIATAVDGVVGAGARVVALAGSRPMDPLDPAFEALRLLGARLERQGVPAHPGSLLWLARTGEIPIVGMPSCGLFSQATVFDLLLTRLLAGERVDGEWLATLGHGGLLTRDMAYRFPPYRASRDRGEVT
jgi:molybdopterin biosynthesis enzyme